MATNADKAEARRLIAVKALRDAILRKHFGVMVTQDDGNYRARAYATNGSDDFEETGETELAAIEAVARLLGIEPAPPNRPPPPESTSSGDTPGSQASPSSRG